ncbi:TPA: hypothetical protein ACS29S_005005 [Klebsiella oxytoca]
MGINYEILRITRADTGTGAERLSDELQGIVVWKDEERTEKAKAIAKSVRESFIALCADD